MTLQKLPKDSRHRIDDSTRLIDPDRTVFYVTECSNRPGQELGLGCQVALREQVLSLIWDEDG